MKRNILLLTAVLACISLDAQLNFTTVEVPSQGNYQRCVVDMNGDFLDDIVSVSSTNINILFQSESGFDAQNFPTSPADNNPGWTLAAGDFNADGYNDLIYGGHNGATFMISDGTGNGFVENSPGQYIFSQRTNFVDINNDGHLDAFVCHDIAPNVYYLNDGENNLDYHQGGIGDYPDGGHYGSLWVDYNNDGLIDMHMSKCGGEEERYTDNLFRNNGDGTFTDVASMANMDLTTQTWSTAWADFNNDGFMDAMVGVSSFSTGGQKLMRNNGDGTFTDVTSGSGFDNFNHTSWIYAPADFNNDGWVDVYGSGDKVMINNGDMTFSPVNVPFSTASIGDLNNDGFLDAFTFGEIYLNNGNLNNWLTINTIGTESNLNGIGARVEIYTEMGKQIRDVRSGEGFSEMNTLNTHFGIGSDHEIQQVIVRWPSGIVDVIENPDVNSTLVIVEGDHQMSVSDLESKLFSIYPNPVKEILNIQGTSIENSNFEIFHITGTKMMNGKVNNGKINVKHLAKGIYIISVKSEGKISTLKFIKQ